MIGIKRHKCLCGKDPVTEKEYFVSFPESFCVAFSENMQILGHEYMLVCVISYSASQETEKGHYFCDILCHKNEVCNMGNECKLHVETFRKKIWISFNDDHVRQWDSFEKMNKEVTHQCVLLYYNKQ